ncbi:hypothetical protein [Streptomyces noursei]|uniref:Uncharacterized protein n=1 Tax=Streptomyces noursei TaxID=1971 RepID=A0A2N8P8J2_STRNR|nr:hypothetical protein [Streptomyces noursei]PNE37320.1 hypothetical protein AOB60_23570 [Streptomyces noursei]
MLAVPGDVVLDELVAGGSLVAPAPDLFAGQVLEDQLLVVVDVLGLRLRLRLRLRATVAVLTCLGM